MTNTIGVVGLGIMGGGMARALLSSGRDVIGYDIAQDATDTLLQSGGKIAAGVSEISAKASIVILSLPSERAFTSTIDQIIEASSSRDLIVVDTSTLPLSAKMRAQEMCASAGITLLDCPVSGTAARLAQRTWDIYCSGPPDAVSRVMPVLKAFTDRITNFGEFGNATKVKLAANHLVAIYNVACAESLAFLRRMDLDTQVVCDMFASSPVLGTGLMRVRLPMMASRVYLPATMKMDVWQKDVQLIREMADQVGCPTPLFDACEPLYAKAMEQGLGLQDTAAVSEILDQTVRNR